MRVSRSGGCMSAIRPHSKRERRRSSSVGIALGGRSLVITIWPPRLWSALKVWKNSSCVLSLPAMNWMSSISRMSTAAVLVAELFAASLADGVDQVVGERLRRDVDDRAAPRHREHVRGRWRAAGGSCPARRRRR